MNVPGYLRPVWEKLLDKEDHEHGHQSEEFARFNYVYHFFAIADGTWFAKLSKEEMQEVMSVLTLHNCGQVPITMEGQ